MILLEVYYNTDLLLSIQFDWLHRFEHLLVESMDRRNPKIHYFQKQEMEHGRKRRTQCLIFVPCPSRLFQFLLQIQQHILYGTKKIFMNCFIKGHTLSPPGSVPSFVY